MKAVVAQALKEMIVSRSDEERWGETLERVGLTRELRLDPMADLEEHVVPQLMGSASEVLGMDPSELADAFGRYWVCEFAPRSYQQFFDGCDSAREFLLRIDDIHVMITSRVTRAYPPRLEYEEPDGRTLVIRYRSHRRLIDLLVGLVRGVGDYYGEPLVVSRLGEDRVKVVFA